MSIETEQLYSDFMTKAFSNNPIKYRINLFNQVRDIPYQTVKVHSWEEALEENIGGCGAKHRLLKKCLEDLGYKCRFAYVPYSWADINWIPENLKDGSQYNRRDLHTFLEVLINNKWTILDATWNKELADFAPVNSSWDGMSDTKIAVPYTKIYHGDDTNELRRQLNCNKDGTPTEEQLDWITKFNNWMNSFL